MVPTWEKERIIADLFISLSHNFTPLLKIIKIYFQEKNNE
jgi:hypothetical protein